MKNISFEIICFLVYTLYNIMITINNQLHKINSYDVFKIKINIFIKEQAMID